MTQTSGNCCHLARGELDFAVFKFEYKAAFDDQKCFVGVRMGVPMIGLGHHADPDNVIVYMGYRVIVVGSRYRCFRG